MTEGPSYAKTKGSFATVRAKDGTTLCVSAGPRSLADDEQTWYLEIRAPDVHSLVRAEWSRGANVSDEHGVEIALVIGSVTTKGVLKNGELILEPRSDEALDHHLRLLGDQFLRFDPEEWPSRPDDGSLNPTLDSFSEWVGCTGAIITLGAGFGGAAGGAADGVKGAGLGAGVGAGLGAVGGAIGCGIGWATLG